MSSKLMLPLIAGFSLCVVGSVPTRAESTSSNEAAPPTTDSQTKPEKKKKGWLPHIPGFGGKS